MSEEIKDDFQEIEWYKIKAFRNIIAHEYFGISGKQVWFTTQIEIPKLKNVVFKMLGEK